MSYLTDEEIKESCPNVSKEERENISQAVDWFTENICKIVARNHAKTNEDQSIK